jgi:hypothetical protein
MFANPWTVPFCLCTFQNELYLSGYYLFKNNGDPGDGICRWNDTTWSELGAGLSDSLGGSAGANEMEVINNKLVIAGGFDFADNLPAKNIVEWDGTRFCAFGGWFDAPIDHIAHFNNQIFVSGPLHLDTVSVNSICRWVGGSYRDSCGSFINAIDQVHQRKAISIYPNPSSGIVNIQGMLTQDTNIQVLDAFGHTVHSSKTNRSLGEVTLNLSDCPNGIYVIQIIGENSDISQRVAILR